MGGAFPEQQNFFSCHTDTGFAYTSLHGVCPFLGTVSLYSASGLVDLLGPSLQSSCRSDRILHSEELVCLLGDRWKDLHF